MLLGASDSKGVCYVETKNLDGETNLKIKSVHKEINNKFDGADHLMGIEGSLLCEKPNGALYKFEGMANLNYLKDNVPINPENIVLRGTVLKNTEYVYGMSVFTGHDTKLMMNSTKAKYKFSKLEMLVNKSMIIVFFLQILLACLAANYGDNFLDAYNNPS